MTCVIGMISKGVVYIGADSAGISNLNLHDRLDRKVFKNGPMILGFCGSFRMGQLLAHKLTIPEHKPERDIYAYMVVEFIDAVRATLKDNGYAEVDKNTEWGGNFLVGYKGRLFQIGADYQVGELRSGITSIGCGAEFALGSMYSTKIADPIKKMRVALQVSAKLNAGVVGPFHFEKTHRVKRTA